MKSLLFVFSGTCGMSIPHTVAVNHSGGDRADTDRGHPVEQQFCRSPARAPGGYGLRSASRSISNDRFPGRYVRAALRSITSQRGPGGNGSRNWPLLVLAIASTTSPVAGRLLKQIVRKILVASPAHLLRCQAAATLPATSPEARCSGGSFGPVAHGRAQCRSPAHR